MAALFHFYWIQSKVRRRLIGASAAALLMLLAVGGLLAPGTVSAQDECLSSSPLGDTVLEDCRNLASWEDRCECRHCIRSLLLEQYSRFTLKPGMSHSIDERRMNYDLESYDRWRMEEYDQMCSRLDLLDTTRGLVRGLALALTGIAAISFVWSIVQYMQESLVGGRVAQARDNSFRIIVGLIIFGSAWLIYESLLVAFFGTSDFSPGSFAGVGGLFYVGVPE